MKAVLGWAWFDRLGNLIPETLSDTKKEAVSDSLYHDEPDDVLYRVKIHRIGKPIRRK